jgi:hypothetical protein
MKLKHNISFVGGDTVKAGDELTPEQAKVLKASGTNYHAVEEKTPTKKKKKDTPSE